MFIVNTYTAAVLLCLVTMLCWGSWGNAQKFTARSWRYELFYWDYVIGMVLSALLLCLTLGSSGADGRPFMKDLSQASAASIGWIFLGGVVFNASNILLSSSTALAGMSVAFPLGVGLALVMGVFFNYFGGAAKGNPVLLFLGVALVAAAILCNGMASGRRDRDTAAPSSRKGIVLAACSGVLMSLFYYLVVKGMDVDDFVNPAAGKTTPYTAIFLFSLGVLASNFLFNTWVMRHPFEGRPVSFRDYAQGDGRTHLVGMAGGAVWCLGTACSYLASGKAGPAVSYALGQGTPMVAALWGLFVWKEFKGAGRRVYTMLAVMFLQFLSGLGFIVAAGAGKEEDRDGDLLHVVSFNMLFEYDWTRQMHLVSGDSTRLWEHRAGVARETFDRYSFDVVGVQELMTFQLDSLTGDGVYSRIGVDLGGLTRPRKENEAVVYRNARIEVLDHGQFWYSDTPDEPGTHWGIHTRGCTWGHFQDRLTGKDFYVFNSHFHVNSPTSKWPDGTPFTNADADSVRIKSALLLLERVGVTVPDGRPVFITGDLNCEDDSRPIAIIRAGGFTDSRDAAPVVEGPKGTFHDFSRGEPPFRIDYVFVRGAADVRSHQVLTDQLETGRWASDHLPVYVTVRLD